MADHLTAVSAESAAIAHHTAERDRAIVAARQAGHTLRAIAAAAGLTHPGVIKIIERTTAMTITDRDIATQVTESLTDHADSHDVDGIVRDIIDRYGRVNIDTIDHDDYWTLVETHAV